MCFQGYLVKEGRYEKGCLPSHESQNIIFHIILTGKVLYDKVGDWHFDKRQYDPTPVPRDMKQPAATVNFPLAREFVRCIYMCVYM